MNKLLLNADKTKLLITCKPKYRNCTTQITLQASQYTITQSSKVKVLGIYITSGLTNTATINNVISKVNFRLSVLREVFKYTKYRTKLMLTNAIIMSVIR